MAGRETAHTVVLIIDRRQPMRTRATEHASFAVVTESGPSHTTDQVSFTVDDTSSGVSVAIGIHLITETVEIWWMSATPLCMAVFDRGHLRAWFTEPTGPIGMGDVTFTLDRDGRRVISLPDVESWVLDNRAATRFRTRL
jgi:hypothetical protein